MKGWPPPIKVKEMAPLLRKVKVTIMPFLLDHLPLCVKGISTLYGEALGCSIEQIVLLIFPLFHILWPVAHLWAVPQIVVVPQ